MTFTPRRVRHRLVDAAADASRWHEQLESLYAMSVEIAGLRRLDQVMDRALDYCLLLTASEFGFVGLIDNPRFLDVAAIKGFTPDRPDFWARWHRIPIRRTIFGLVVIEGRSIISNDVTNDPNHVGAPLGHPPVRTFLGVPLKVRNETIGMIGVANREAGYDADHERLLATFANQVAVAITNARLYEEQQQMIADLQALHARLDAAEVAAMLHQERNRIAEELHDRVAQIMFSIGIELASAIERVEPGDVASDLRKSKDLAARGIEESRRAVYNLTNDPPAGHSLVTDLREAIAVYDRSELQVDLVVDGAVYRLPAETEDALYRVALEALTNVQRHAEADVAIVSLRYEPSTVTLVIQDNGRGMSARMLDSYRGAFGHLGLKTMRRRVERVGGRFMLQTGEDGGLVVRATVPAKRVDQ